MSVHPECVVQAVAQEGKALTAELDEERRKYQGLLREFTRLEQRYENLREMSMLTEVLTHYIQLHIPLAWVPAFLFCLCDVSM